MTDPQVPERRSRRGCLVAAVIALLVVLAGAGVTVTLLRHKDVDARWEPCGVGGRGVRSIAVSPDGRLFVAANEAGRGDVWLSDNQCASFTPAGLQSEAIWVVAWLARARALCAGTRDGLYCLVGGGLRGPLTSSEVCFVLETRDGIVAGGWPDLLFGKADLTQFVPLMRLGRAPSDAVTTDWATLVAGPGLLASVDGGRSFAPVPGAGFGASALAAHGARVYAGGGSFGGWLRRSDNGGQRWAQIEMPGSQPEVLLTTPGRPDVVLLGTHGDVRPGDAYVSMDGGASWRALGCPGAEVHTLAMDEQYLYCGATSLTGEKGMWRMPLVALGLGTAGPTI